MKKTRIILLMALISLCQVGFAKSSLQVRVLTFNIMHGATMKQDFDLQKIAGIINKLKPDLVALQELDYNTGRSNKHYYDLAAELGVRTQMSPLFGKAISFDGGQYGIGILSKTSFVKTENTALPMIKKSEARTMLKAITVLNTNDTVTFICSHFDVEDDNINRLVQADKVVETIKASKYPVIFAGDLNDTPSSEVIRKLEKTLKNTESPDTKTMTYSSTNPQKKIDYIFMYPKNRWKTISTEAITDTVASDHLAYFSVIEIQ
jgi:endonuclease/exonuclease/phosphatase family metal-dependent hydrolase